MFECRDGVSEGQFNQVLLYEMDAIRKVMVLYKSFIFCMFVATVYIFTINCCVILGNYIEHIITSILIVIGARILYRHTQLYASF